MSFPTNTSPYGMRQNIPASPQFKAPRQESSLTDDDPFLQALFGKSEKNYQQSNLGPEQQGLYNQLLAAGQQKGAGGAFGQSADYYRDLFSDDSSTYNSMINPEMRRFREQIIPDLAEQFAGMGSGGLSSSGFRNAGIAAGTDLSERLGAIRAQLRQQGAQGLSSIGQMGLGGFNENVNRPETYGYVGEFAKAAGNAAGKAGTAALMA